jgi:hypothetical protein
MNGTVGRLLLIDGLVKKGEYENARNAIENRS